MLKLKKSYFKDEYKRNSFIKKWKTDLEHLNNCKYEEIHLNTSLGRTIVYGINTERDDFETLLIFPGYRTSTLFWDLDHNLKSLKEKYKIYLVETNGQPNLSDGYTPKIKSNDYGVWGAELFEKLNIDNAFIAGASFGGLICAKIALAIPKKLKAAFLLNAACLSFISLKPKNLYYNLLPVFSPSRKNIQSFLDSVVFFKPEHTVSINAQKLLIDYLSFALKEYKDKADKPYNMKSELSKITVDFHLFFGEKDILFPYKEALLNANRFLGDSLKSTVIFNNVGHGIETYTPAIKHVDKIITSYLK